MNENRKIKGCLEIKSCLKIKRWLKFYINRWTLLVNFPEWLYFRSTLTFQNLWLKSDYPSSRKTMLVIDLIYKIRVSLENYPIHIFLHLDFCWCFQQTVTFRKEAKKYITMLTLLRNVQSLRLITLWMCRFLNYWSSELKLFFGGPFPFLHFYTSLNPWQERGRNAFNHPLYCTTSFLTVRPGQARCFLLLVLPIILLPSRTIVNCCPIVKKQICVPTVDQKVLSNVQQRVNFSLWEPVTGSTSSQQRWNEQEVSFFIAPAGRLTSSSYLSSQSKYDK